ncbi:ABC transporter substrate-binding protein [Thiohalorhabdus denitrificans]|uniref:ABC transporter substrate-binding protein n=1 Tax=Thiohalorhabdus denitrificans TaxID=381306 RepID=UPI0015A04CAF|nr:ABC transporter substrate-binding protein [Thiohalorhabdus denitrificans]
MLGTPADETGAAERPTVASINACTDQLVLELADPGQLVTVSEYARSPAFSYMAEAAAEYPLNSGHAEEVMAHDPDLVVGGPYTKRETRNRLDALGYRMVTLDSPDTFPGIRETIRRMAGLLGHPERGERLIAEMDRTLEAVAERLPPREERLRALALRANGVTVGEGALLDTIMEAAGLRNVGREVGAGSYKEFPLEKLVTTRPDLLILAGFAKAEPSLAQGVMHHPVFASLETKRPRMWLPGRLWSCGGWFNAEAVARLAEHAYGISVPQSGNTDRP